MYSSVYKNLRTSSAALNPVAPVSILTYSVGQKAMVNAKPGLAVRDLDSAADLRLAIGLEKEVWESADADVTPLTLAVATRAAGAMWLGAFDGSELVGFAFALPSIEHGGLGFHSHMLGVRTAYRSMGVGRSLKMAQRQRALALGVKTMTWTFDPLRAANAHMNLSKLGVTSHEYRMDFYGPRTSSPLHVNGTDRLWLTWAMGERRVEDRLQGKDSRAEVLDALAHLEPMVRFNGNGKPAEGDLLNALARQRIAIEIPGDIGGIEKNDPALGHEWRMATRRAFMEAINAGFVVTEFCRSIRGQQGPGAYLLEKVER